MAIIKECDRCKKTYHPYNERISESKPNGIMLLNIETNQRYHKHPAKDLCYECMSSLGQWLTDKDLIIPFPGYNKFLIYNAYDALVEARDNGRDEDLGLAIDEAIGWLGQILGEGDDTDEGDVE